MEDFGFTLESIEEVQPDNRAELLLVSMNEFLDRLKSNPSANTIKWPNRVEEIEKFQIKLKSIVEGTTNGNTNPVT